MPTTRLIRPQIVGEWQITRALLDDEIQEGWSGTVLRFGQDSEITGRYQTSASPLDSVWTSAGTWWMEDRNAAPFIREDSIGVSFMRNDDAMTLILFHPGYVIPCDPDTADCPLQFTGLWILSSSK